MNGDGRIDNSDLLLYYPILQNVGDANALAAYNQLLGPPLAGFTIHVGDSLMLSSNQPGTTSPPLSFSWDLNGLGTFDITGANATLTWSQLANYGITDVGTYPVAEQVTDGTNTIYFSTVVTVTAMSLPSSGLATGFTQDTGLAAAAAFGLQTAWTPSAWSIGSEEGSGQSVVSVSLNSQDLLHAIFRPLPQPVADRTVWDELFLGILVADPISSRRETIS
jgi:hypothetical protein